MSNCSLQHTYLLLLLSFFVDQGHGRWKPTSDKLHKDIELYKQMTKRIKQELEAYHDKYSDDTFDDYYIGDNKYLDSQIDYDVKKYIKYDHSKDTHSSSKSNVNGTQLNESYDTKSTEKTKSNKDNVVSFDKKWPKFEDILSAIGKKYDWKNDRWIKIKHTYKTQNNVQYNTTLSREEATYEVNIPGLGTGRLAAASANPTVIFFTTANLCLMIIC